MLRLLRDLFHDALSDSECQPAYVKARWRQLWRLERSIEYHRRRYRPLAPLAPQLRRTAK